MEDAVGDRVLIQVQNQPEYYYHIIWYVQKCAQMI